MRALSMGGLTKTLSWSTKILPLLLVASSATASKLARAALSSGPRPRSLGMPSGTIGMVLLSLRPVAGVSGRLNGDFVGVDWGKGPDIGSIGTNGYGSLLELSV